MNWAPQTLKVGDIVECPSEPKWGEGTVLDTLFLGDMPLPDGTTITYQRNTKGQRVSVRFADGRTRTLLTPVNPLKIIK